MRSMMMGIGNACDDVEPSANKYLYLRSIFPFLYGIIHVVLPYTDEAQNNLTSFIICRKVLYPKKV